MVPSKFILRLVIYLNKSLTETACDVVLGQLVFGTGEDLCGGSDLDQVSQVKIGGALRNAGRLLHGVSDDYDGILLAQFVN